MDNRIVILHPDLSSGGWAFVPSPEQVTACEAFLRCRMMIKGESLSPEPGEWLWAGGPGLKFAGLDSYHSEYVRLDVAQRPVPVVPPGLELSCPACGRAVDMADWSGALSALLEQAAEVRVPCGCAEGIPLLQCTALPGLVVARFQITLEGQATQLHPDFLSGLSEAVGVPMTFTSLEV